MRIGALSLLGVWLLIGCSGDGHHDAEDMDAAVLSADSGTGSYECVDEDGDGFGKSCKKGRDCNDADPDITDLCFRCRDPKKPGKGCPCLIDGGTPDPMKCDPDDLRTTQNGVMGTLVCSEGTRYCRDAAWSDCEIIFQYATFHPDSQ